MDESVRMLKKDSQSEINGKRQQKSITHLPSHKMEDYFFESRFKFITKTVYLEIFFQTPQN